MQTGLTCIYAYVHDCVFRIPGHYVRLAGGDGYGGEGVRHLVGSDPGGRDTEEWPALHI